MEASASPVHMDLQCALKYSGGPFLTALCRAVTFHTSKFRARAETALFLSPFTLPSSAITVIRLQLSDFDSARTRPVWRAGWVGGWMMGWGESVTDVECSTAPPSVSPWLMFKEWSEKPHDHLASQPEAPYSHPPLSPRMKVIFSEILNNYCTQLCLNVSDVKWRSVIFE